MRRWWKRQAPLFLGTLAYWLVRAIGSTLRIKVVGLDAVANLGHGSILCGWHGKSLVPALTLRKKGVWVIISHSRDGEMQNLVFSRLGFKVIRGSTGRGGVRAAVEAIRVLRQGAMMAVTPDGPRGPSGVVQGGVMLMAQKSGAALVPVGLSARPAIRVPSWDRYLVPLPFARCVFHLGEPLYVPMSATDEAVEELRLRLEEGISEAEQRATE